MAIIGDFFKAVAQFSDRRFLLVLLKSVGITLLVFIVLTWASVWFVGFLPNSLGEWPLLGEVVLPTAALQGITLLGMILASTFMMIPVAAICVGFFLEEIAQAVEDRHYQGLGPAREITTGEAIATATRFFLLVIGVNLVALIPYLILPFIIGPFAILVPWAVNGFLLGREYFELVALRRVRPRSMKLMRAHNFWRTWFSGSLMAAALTIPIMNLLIPVLGVATITHQFHRIWDEEGDLDHFSGR